MKREYTKAEKAVYFKNLREQWKAAKATANVDEIKAIIMTHGLQISITGYCMVAAQMKALNLDGIPYLDAKTFLGWKENGYKVRKGEHSNIHGCSWKRVGGNGNGEGEVEPVEGEVDNGYLLPVAYHLFHRTQVEEIN